MMRGIAPLSIVAALLAAAILTGCGSGGDSDSASSASSGPEGPQAAGGSTTTEETRTDDGGPAATGRPSGTDGAGSAGGSSDDGGTDKSDEAATGNGGGAGSGGDESSAQDEGESNAQFIAEANAICAKGTSEIQGQMQSYLTRKVSKGEESVVQGEIVNEVVAPVLEGEIEDIRALGLPPGDEEQVEAIFTAMQAVIDQASDDPPAFMQQKEPFEEPEGLAKSYGLSACGGV